MKVMAIDPGDRQSAYVIWDGSRIAESNIIGNDSLKNAMKITPSLTSGNSVSIEMIASYGMPVGKTVFETCLFIGRIQQICEDAGIPCTLVYRKDVKMHLCGSMKAKDGNIRQALIDRFGDKGTKNNKGVTYGLSKDMWSAFAIGVYFFDKQSN